MAFPFNSRFDQLGGGDLTLRLREQAESGRVQLPYYYYDIVADGVPVGKISIRVGDNYHTYYNGHIGYEVDEGARGHGYARRACALALDVARFHGMKRLYITCAEDNAASYAPLKSWAGGCWRSAGCPGTTSPGTRASPGTGSIN